MDYVALAVALVGLANILLGAYRFCGPMPRWAKVKMNRTENLDVHYQIMLEVIGSGIDLIMGGIALIVVSGAYIIMLLVF